MRSDQGAQMVTTASETSIFRVPGTSFEETRNSMLAQTVFQVRDESYSWEDIFISAKLSGEWSSLEKRVSRGIACQEKLQFLEEELDEAELESACDAFRYEKDLIAVEDPEAWLGKRGLSVEDWIEFIERKLLLDQWSDAEAAEALLCIRDDGEPPTSLSAILDVEFEEYSS
jgi:hypothetical protein